MKKKLITLTIILAAAFAIISEDSPYEFLGALMCIVLLIYFVMKDIYTYKKSCNMITDNFHTLSRCGFVSFVFNLI